MQNQRILALIALASGMAACSALPHHREPDTRITSTGELAGNRWNATLSTPSDLAGALQVRGTAYWAPRVSGSSSTVAVYISNATTGGLHPWHLHRGQCGADAGLVGEETTYPMLGVDKQGNASASATLGMPLPMSGDYFVAISASPNNRSAIIACGNLAPPVH